MAVSPKSLANLKRGGGAGRPQGLAAYVRKSTKDGQELAKFMLSIFRGQAVKAVLRVPFAPREDLEPKEIFPTVSERIEAASWLADRGFGRATQALELSGPDGGPIETQDAAAAEFRSRVVGLVTRVGAGRPALDAVNGHTGEAAS